MNGGEKQTSILTFTQPPRVLTPYNTNCLWQSGNTKLQSVGQLLQRSNVMALVWHSGCGHAAFRMNCHRVYVEAQECQIIKAPLIKINFLKRPEAS